MRMQRADIAAAVLAVITAVSSFFALRQPGTPRSELAGLETPAAPVLSLRRAPAFLTRTIADAKLAADLDRSLRNAPATTCLVVREGSRTLYSRNPDQPLIPASNVKIATAHALLAKLGPTETLTTSVRAAKPMSKDGTIEGDLYIVGGGDPVLETDRKSVV
jgi:D-alanyl-D-alanine carboxypeptidase/D-alanyl-D-alanine-endopeptidase (penicillin-binding protein 4)